MGDLNNLERLLIEIKESLERDIHRLENKIDVFRDEMMDRFDAPSIRLERHAALLQTGSRWTNRMTKSSDKVDSALESRDKRISDLTRRVENLENRKPPPQQ